MSRNKTGSEAKDLAHTHTHTHTHNNTTTHTHTPARTPTHTHTHTQTTHTAHTHTAHTHTQHTRTRTHTHTHTQIPGSKGCLNSLLILDLKSIIHNDSKRKIIKVIDLSEECTFSVDGFAK